MHIGRSQIIFWIFHIFQIKRARANMEGWLHNLLWFEGNFAIFATKYLRKDLKLSMKINEFNNAKY